MARFALALERRISPIWQTAKKYDGREGEPGHLEKGEIVLGFFGGNLPLDTCINDANRPQGY
jgi:hypothetical protein